MDEPALTPSAPTPAPAPADQHAAWNGPEGASWAEHSARTVPGGDFSADVLAAAGIGHAERVLDIGCGTGGLTLDAARVAVDGHALGIDLSEVMIARAREAATSSRIANVSFTVDDAATHRYDPAGIDVALSHFGAMFFPDPVGAFSNITTALRPGGRLVVVCPAAMDRCDWYGVPLTALSGTAPTPETAPSAMFSLSEPAVVHRVLADAGLGRVEVEPLEGSLWFGADADRAAEMFLGSGPVRGFLQRTPSMSEDAAFDILREAVSPFLAADGIRLPGAHWLVRAERPGTGS